MQGTQSTYCHYSFTFSRSINWSSGTSYSSSLLTANVVVRALLQSLSSSTIRNSHPNRFLMESMRSITKCPLVLSTDSLMVCGGRGGGPTSIVQRRHIPVVTLLRSNLVRLLVSSVSIRTQIIMFARKNSKKI